MQWLIDQLKLFDIKPSQSYIGWVLFLVSYHGEDFRNECQRFSLVSPSPRFTLEVTVFQA